MKNVAVENGTENGEEKRSGRPKAPKAPKANKVLLYAILLSYLRDVALDVGICIQIEKIPSDDHGIS